MHLVAAIVWIGGMFFAHMALRPASQFLDLPERLRLWEGVLRRFFVWVLVAVTVLLVTGYGMIGHLVGPNMFRDMAASLLAMQAMGLVMIALFVYVLLSPYRQLRRRIRESLLPEAGMYLGKIRLIVTINLILGLLTAMIAAGGRYW
jgi:uncharacterized membrane protein